MKADLRSGRTAVLVLDCQELFTSETGPFENRTVQPVIEALNRLLAGARELGAPVIFSNYAIRADLLDAGLLADAPFVKNGLLSHGSPLLGVDPRIRRVEGDIEVWHNRPSAFFRTDLEAILASLGVEAVVLAGLSVNNAISATARDAFARDVPTLIVRECTGAAPFEPPELDTYFTILDTWTAEVADLEDVLQRLRRLATPRPVPR
jgi:nicotinamidase-related amidase